MSPILCNKRGRSLSSTVCSLCELSTKAILCETRFNEARSEDAVFRLSSIDGGGATTTSTSTSALATGVFILIESEAEDCDAFGFVFRYDIMGQGTSIM